MRSKKTSIFSQAALSQLVPHRGCTHVPACTSLTSLWWRPRWVQPRVGEMSYVNGEGHFMSLGGEPDWEERARNVEQHSIFSK